ncbi:hypothetical protein DQ244_12075 [Blastococcus sp. TBT05-19]|uniref:hypothetical protein n=1 Tax=Blastococcus sp. TBT05-19 TaxID=2250581 RepID=UPI000DE9C979|nr:hypothetical protein [Blastococcus sp. TBT05-19]RBY90200.1 hypothetical protein DQ244_12075 [Blastococcus sp. TBT05-19]
MTGVPRSVPAGPASSRTRGGRTAAALLAAALGTGALAGCSDPAGPVAGAVATDDLRAIEDDLGVLEDRVRALEDAMADDEPVVDDEAGVLDDARALAGQEVTVSAEVSELVTTTDVGGAFRIGKDSGEPIAVIMATPPEQLDRSDVVRVSGAVVEVQPDSFETDFGIAADALVDDPDAFLADLEGEVAIAADRVEVLQEQAEG